MLIRFCKSKKAVLIIVLLFIHSASFGGDSWKRILYNKGGKATFYWFPNNVNVSNSKDVIDGVEHDLSFAFIDFLNQQYNVDIQIEWVETSSFSEVMETVRNESGGVFGASSISVTQDRATYLNFTPPYLADIAVLVSGPELPIAYTPNEFREIFQNQTAITIPNTTLYDALLELKNKHQVEFDVDFVENSGEVISAIEKQKNGFGYIDLPNFLVSVRNGSKIRRQFFFPIKLEGLAMIYPKNSDWDEPINAYFNSDQFQKDKERIITSYFGKDTWSIIEQISRSAEIGPLEEIVISTREKELRYEELLEAKIREQEETRLNNILFIVLGFGGFGLFFLIVNNRIKTRTNHVLIDQQKTIEKRNAQLRQLNDEKNDLIKVLAHDLRSPLSHIVGSIMVLKQSDKLDKDTQQMIEFIAQGSKKIESMIEKILDVDAIESGQRNMNLEAVSVMEVAKQVISSNSERAKRKDIKLKENLDKVPNAEADQFYLTQVVENLVSNAIKFSEKGTEIEVSLKTHNGKVRISVKDQGPGFSEEDQLNIFRKFHKLTAQPTGGEDTIGLGLSIVKSYTEMMGGKVTFETEEGKGTEFFVDLMIVD